jgi:ankyrin repeat protein
MNITRAQIRIWIHERDIAKLESIVWSGNGDKLLTETTNNSKVKKFLDNVPHLLTRIKSIHTAAIHNDVNSLKVLKDRTSDIEEVFTAKDSHGLTPLHKAAGLGNRTSVEYLLYEAPSMLNEVLKYSIVELFQVLLFHRSAIIENLYFLILTSGGQ